MSVRTGLSKLYNGETDVQIVPRWKLWFTISAVLIAIGVAGLLGRGLNLGIDFEGGVSWEVPANGASVDDVEAALADTDVEVSRVQSLDSSSGRIIRVQAAEVEEGARGDVITALTEVTGVERNEVSFNEVGPSWGEEISEKAVRALVIFLVLVSLYIAIRFEWKMALATLAALLHDILITVGVYAVLNLSVTPATVIAFLTILGYSIYDGIVVFDRVDENASKAAGDETYAGLVNRSLNEVLMRTLNTSITALLPIASLIVVGSRILGASALEEFALALFVGLLSGAYSSLFIASPLLALLKEREAKWKAVRRKAEGRGIAAPPARERLQPTGGERTATAVLEREVEADPSPPAAPERRPAPGPVIQPRGRKKGRRR